MEEKLAAYRASKAKQHSGSGLTRLRAFFGASSSKTSKSSDSATIMDPVVDTCNPDTSIEEEWTGVDSEEQMTESECSYLQRIALKLYSVNFLLKTGLWISLLCFFAQLGFGAVYFVVSLLVIMFLSMKKNSRKLHEPSAYSVFNKDCERIDGTFTAEQFEKQMIYGGAVRK